SAHPTCRDCCATHAASGCAVHPARCTRRLPTSIKNRTYSRRSQTVSTVKKSTAMIVSACVRRNSRHDGPRSMAGGAETIRTQNVSEGCGRYGDAEPFQLADNSFVALRVGENWSQP